MGGLDCGCNGHQPALGMLYLRSSAAIHADGAQRHYYCTNIACAAITSAVDQLVLFLWLLATHVCIMVVLCRSAQGERARVAL